MSLNHPPPIQKNSKNGPVYLNAPFLSMVPPASQVKETCKIFFKIFFSVPATYSNKKVKTMRPSILQCRNGCHERCTLAMNATP